MSPRRGGGYQVLHAAGLAPVDGLHRAVKALRRFAEWRDSTLAPRGTGSPEPGPASAMSKRALSYEQSRELLSSAGVRVPRESFVTSAPGAAQAADWIGGPVVLKLSAPGLIHKTEVGGVWLDVRGGEQAAAIFGEMTSPQRLAPFGIEADGVFVQEMVAGGLDLLVSVHDDEVFGPVLTIGAGGVATEIERDVAHLAIPFRDEELAGALRGLRLWPLLAGFRGKPGPDLSALARVACAIAEVYLSQAAVIAEIEINPLRIVVDAGQTSCVALDAVVLRR
jgi:acyl-CoA synthetase (NDP forming)